MNKIKWHEHQFRCSQLFKLMTGTIGLTEAKERDLETLEIRHRKAGIKQAKPLTEKMIETMEALQEAKANPVLPKTVETELREIWRAQTFKRNFIFTNKYVQKGIQQEEEAITVLQQYHKKVLGKPLLLTKNEKRFRNKWITGEPDLQIGKSVKGKWKDGSDTKCSWNLKSFPFEEDELKVNYECQNQGYMWLTGAEHWTTDHVLVNATEHQLYLEKQKFYYAYNSPSEGDRFYDEMIQKQRECELMMIFDRARFEEKYPNHDFEIPKDEWFGEDYDIPLEYRVCTHHSFADKRYVEAFKQRIDLGRFYMNQLNKRL